MTPKQIELVQGTWRKVLPIADTAAEMFYARLFAMDPAVKPLFKGDMKAQGRKLTSMISTAVNGLTNLESIVPAVQELGRRHAAYGVKESHYDTVGAALLWTLEQGLGDAFTVEAKSAWASAYGVLAKTMKDAAAAVPA
ncbi:MAG: globin family protein [Pseudomonadota bacterium]